MMERCLYRFQTIEKLNGTIIEKHSYKLKYGMLPTEPETPIALYTDFDQLISNIEDNKQECNECSLSVRYTLLRKIPYIHYAFDAFEYIDVFKEDFKSYELIQTVQQYDRYNIDELRKYLSATDFCLWLKDQNLSLNVNLKG